MNDSEKQRCSPFFRDLSVPKTRTAEKWSQAFGAAGLIRWPNAETKTRFEQWVKQNRHHKIVAAAQNASNSSSSYGHDEFRFLDRVSADPFEPGRIRAGGIDLGKARPEFQFLWAGQRLCKSVMDIFSIGARKEFASTEETSTAPGQAIEEGEDKTATESPEGTHTSEETDTYDTIERSWNWFLDTDAENTTWRDEDEEAIVQVHRVLARVGGMGSIDSMTQSMFSGFDISSGARLLLRQEVIEHWGRTAMADGKALPLAQARTRLMKWNRKSPVVILEVFALPMYGDNESVLELEKRRDMQEALARSCWRGWWGVDTVATALGPCSVRPEAMTDPGFLNTLVGMMGQALVSDMAGSVDEKTLKAIAAEVSDKWQRWHAISENTQHIAPRVWPGVRVWVGTLDEHDHLSDALSRRHPMPPIREELTRTWWRVCLDRDVMDPMSPHKVLFYPPAPPTVSQVQAFAWSMFQSMTRVTRWAPVDSFGLSWQSRKGWAKVYYKEKKTHAGKVSRLCPQPWPRVKGCPRAYRDDMGQDVESRLEARDMDGKILARSPPVPTMLLMAERKVFMDFMKRECSVTRIDVGSSWLRELTRKPPAEIDTGRGLGPFSHRLPTLANEQRFIEMKKKSPGPSSGPSRENASEQGGTRHE